MKYCYFYSKLTSKTQKIKDMKKQIKLFSLLIVTLLTLNSCGYNSMVSLDEEVEGQWGNVQNAYQARADLIPNLVSTVKGAANFEKETLEAVVNARARATGVTVDPTNLTPDAIKKFEEAQSGLNSALSRLLATVESYPELKATDAFRDLQSQLEGIENRIRVERNRFNDQVKNYNKYVRSFPNNITAGIFGFSKKGYFESDAGAENAPEVKF